MIKKKFTNFKKMILSAFKNKVRLQRWQFIIVLLLMILSYIVLFLTMVFQKFYLMIIALILMRISIKLTHHWHYQNIEKK
ncbi:MAG: hypothetical protein ACOCP8_01500 [archaeon]